MSRICIYCICIYCICGIKEQNKSKVYLVQDMYVNSFKILRNFKMIQLNESFLKVYEKQFLVNLRCFLQSYVEFSQNSALQREKLRKQYIFSYIFSIFFSIFLGKAISKALRRPGVYRCCYFVLIT